MLSYHIVAFSLLCSTTTIAQKENTRINIKRTPDGIVENIVFQDLLTNKETNFNVIQNNPYNHLGLRMQLASGKSESQYDLSGYDKRQILTQFFSSKHLTDNELSQINFTKAQSNSYVRTFKEHTVVAYYLHLYGKTSILGLKSKVLVLNNAGNVISNIQENDQGYFSPVVTKDGKYIAYNIGDIIPDESFSIIKPTEFKICEVTSGKEIFMISNSDEYSILSPEVFENVIIQVLQKRDNVYEYYVILPNERVIYKKDYSTREVGELLRFQTNGFVFKGFNGDERVDEFSLDFIKETF